MTTANLWRWALGAVVGELGIFPTALPAGETNVLLHYDAVWRYHDSGTDLGTAWREPSYEDAAWASGPGVLAYAGNEPLPDEALAQGARVQTVLRFTGSFGEQVSTHYFRRRVTVPAYTNHATLLFSNLLDDGAVFYWNGQEIHRFNMPTGIIDYASPAMRAVEASTGAVVFSAAPVALVPGDHLLAVEVHQPGGTSSDVVFGLGLSMFTTAPPEVRVPPADQVVEDGHPLSLWVEAVGEDLRYQWQRESSGNFTNLTATTNALYSVATTRLTDAGYYRVLVANGAASVTSRVAQVSVVPDQTGPALVSATARAVPPFYRIAVTFSESVDVASGRSAANYLIEDLDTGERPAFSLAGFPQGALVTLQLTDLDPARRYRLSVNQVKDRSGNVMAPDSQAPVRIATLLSVAPMDHVWRWSEDNVPLPPEWKTNHLAPYLYGEAPGVFYNSFGGADFCRGAQNTWISVGPATHYFSTQVLLPEVPPEGILHLVALVDDGAVVYLNGAECFRYNLPDGAIHHLTTAMQIIAQAMCLTNTVTVTNLRSGVNVLAAEVHQLATDSRPDVVFGLDVQAEVFPSWPLPAQSIPVLHLERLDPQVTLSWTGGGWALEWADRVTGPWREVQPGQANPYSTTLTNAASRFWRLKQKQF